MSRWIAKTVVFAASLVLVLIRAPHGNRSRTVKVASSSRGKLELCLLTMAWIGFFIPLIWIVTPLFSFANYMLRPEPFAAGVVIYVIGLWLFHRSHVDLGTNWSITLEIREGHRLVTRGVYRRIRHPMYTALLLYSLGQTLVVPNWFVGPSNLVTFVILLACRLSAEERMMISHFDEEYSHYRSRTKRLIPGIW